MGKTKQQHQQMAAKPAWHNPAKNYSREEVEAMIRRRAQELCDKRGCAPGNDLADWFAAEKMVKQELRLGG